MIQPEPKPNHGGGRESVPIRNHQDGTTTTITRFDMNNPDDHADMMEMTKHFEGVYLNDLPSRCPTSNPSAEIISIGELP